MIGGAAIVVISSCQSCAPLPAWAEVVAVLLVLAVGIGFVAWALRQWWNDWRR